MSTDAQPPPSATLEGEAPAESLLRDRGLRRTNVRHYEREGFVVKHVSASHRGKGFAEPSPITGRLAGGCFR
ncbi:MAG: hypothetical protein NZ741_09030, partial [Armatimonadetes bacterium]|nr:hypothetical protein [Armatimonadota bacterium]